MVIKNKDGSEYKLNKPNPHMKNQLLWDHFELHNMNFEDIKGLIKKKDITQTKIEIKKEEPIKEEITEDYIKEDGIKEEAKQEIIQSQEDLKKEESPKEESNVKKTLVFCLPAKTKIFEDVLYGEIKKSITYEKKFKFEAIILNITDISMELWTNAVNIEKESILYPQNFEKRWWKVSNISKKFDGNILYCVLSTMTPSFEDLQQ